MRHLLRAEPGVTRGAVLGLGPMLVGLLLSSSCRGPRTLPAPAVSELAAAVSLPYRDTGVPLVRLDFDDGISGWFILDSGSSHSLVDGHFARRVGWTEYAFGSPLQTTRDGQVIAQLDRFVHVERLRLAEVLVEDLYAPLVDLRQVPGRPAGLIGQDLLAHWAVLFTPGSASIHLCPDAESATRLLGLAAGSARRIPTSRTLRGVPVFDWELGDGALPAVVDTGATHCALPTEVLDRLGSTPIEAGRWIGLEGPQECRVHQLPPDALGLRDGPAWIRVVDGRGARVGFTLLSHDAFVLDGPGQALWILKTTGVPGG